MLPDSIPTPLVPYNKPCMLLHELLSSLSILYSLRLSPFGFHSSNPNLIFLSEIKSHSLGIPLLFILVADRLTLKPQQKLGSIHLLSPLTRARE